MTRWGREREREEGEKEEAGDRWAEECAVLRCALRRVRTCFVIPSVMSTLLFKQLTHVFAGLA